MTEQLPPCPVCGVSRDEYEALKARLAKAESRMLGDEYQIPAEWDLTPEPRAIFLLLLAHPVVGVELYEQSRAARHVRHIEWPDNTFQVQASKLRRSLAPYGVKISTVRLEGYSLQDREAWKERLRAQPLRRGGAS